MGILAIARILKELWYGADLVGFRLINLETGEIKDANIESIKKVLASNKITIENLALKGNEIIGNDCPISRYPYTITDRFETVNNERVIVSKINSDEYVVASSAGAVTITNKNSIAEYNIVNGMRVVGTPTTHFVPINREYRYKEISEDTMAWRKNCKLTSLGCNYRFVGENSTALLARGIEELKITEIMGHMHKIDWLFVDIRSIQLPSTWKTIPKFMFDNCMIKNVGIQYGTEKIDIGAFYKCKYIDNLIIPESVKTIEESAFYGAYIKRLVITNKDINISYDAFELCEINELVIPKELGQNHFYNSKIRKYITM